MRVLLLIVFFSFNLVVQAEPVALEKSTSPDGKYFITVDPSPNDYEDGTGVLQVRSTKDKKILGSFTWRQFNQHIAPDSATILWKEDSRAFAITWYMAQDWTGSQIYAESSFVWSVLSIPKFQRRFIGHPGWTGRGKGQFVAIEWMPDNILKMRFDESLAWNGVGDKPDISALDEIDLVFLRLVRPSIGPTFELQSVQAPESAPKTSN